MRTCDLHCHSTFSDGTCTPTEIVKLAKEIGLSAIALTDHNTSQGLPEFMEAGKTYDVITVPGCEFSTDYHETELHIVGLFFPQESWLQIEDYVEIMNMSKHFSNESLISALNKGGYEITYDECKALTDSVEFNRAHVARVLQKKGYVDTISEAFDSLLKEGKGYYKHAKRLNVFETIRFIKSNGGVAILAHPFLNLDYDELEVFLQKAKPHGLDAMETNYSTFTEEQTKQAVFLVNKYGLKQSGGSDFHGAAKPDISLGSGRGSLEVPYSFYEELVPKG